VSRPTSQSSFRRIAFPTWLAAIWLGAVASADPGLPAAAASEELQRVTAKGQDLRQVAATSQAPLLSSTPSLDPLLFVSPRGTGFFSGAAPDLAKGLALNGALSFGADRALQHGQPEPSLGVDLGTSSAFTIAPIVRTHYGWVAGASAYALAVAAGTYSYTREEGSGSSVLLSSALGLAVGEAVAHHSSRARTMQDHLILGRKGLGLKMKF